jgi:hypothetical protein
VTTLFGYPVKLTLDLDGEPLNVTPCIGIEDATTGRGIFIDPDKLVQAINRAQIDDARRDPRVKRLAAISDALLKTLRDQGRIR